MDRRAFLGAFGLLAVPRAARAQHVGSMRRVALVLSNTPEADIAGLHPQNRAVSAFLDAIRGLGWRDGDNIAIVRRSAEGNPNRYNAVAREIVDLKVDVIVASGPIALTMRQATDAIPIVAINVGLGAEWGVRSLARPGGNVTGLTTLANSTVLEKRLQLLKEAAPKISRVAYFTDRGTSTMPDAAARTLGLTLVPIAVAAPDEIQGAFDTINRQRMDALFVDHGRFILRYRSAITGFAAKQRLPASYPFDEFARGGGLMSYGANLVDLFRRAATYVDKILKGVRPGDLPIEEPNTFELVINLKTAKALGLTIPPSLLQRADHVIE
jgi:putative ABC transport system substrate-binding protein